MTIIIISGEKGVGYSWQSCRLYLIPLTAMAPQFAYITLNRKLQPDSIILKMHIQHVIKEATPQKEATLPGWHSYGRYGHVQVGRNSS